MITIIARMIKNKNNLVNMINIKTKIIKNQINLLNMMNIKKKKFILKKMNNNIKMITTKII